MNNIKAFVFLSVVAVFLVLIGDMLADAHGIYFAIVIVALIVLFSVFNANSVPLNLYKASVLGTDDPHQLRAIVQTLSEKAKISAPKIFMIETEAANICAVGRNQRHASIALTSGLLTTLRTDELTAVIAQAIAQITLKNAFLNSMIATFAGSISGLANIQLSEIFFDEKDKNRAVNPKVMAIVAPLAAIIVKSVISPNNQFNADKTAVKWCEAASLITALEKLETAKLSKKFLIADQRPATAHLFIINPIDDKKLAKLFNAQPATEKRIQQLNSLT